MNWIGLRLRAELNGTTKTDEPLATPVTTSPTQLQSQASILQCETPQDSSTDLLIEDLVNIGHPWSTGLFDCWENPRNAVVTAFFPCVTFGQIAEVLDEGSSCGGRGLIYLLLIMASYSQWIMSTEYRTKLRKKFRLEEEPCTDVATHIFCPCCALCQEFRELQNRQLDPSLGWNRIFAQQQGEQCDGQLISSPPPNQIMSK